ncbi:hypothetical protein BT93_H2521 [Corymbia citriodora subsp. variegata]|nr:hypothetical protein BT93_H2521 [Corymbia citriodora subsp. variegata]
MEEQSVLPLFIVSLVIIFFTRKLITREPDGNFPPSPPSLPIIGHLHHLKKPVHRTLLALSWTYGPIISFRIGARRFVVVSSRSLAEECFTRHDVVLANRPRFLLGEYITYNYTNLGSAPYGNHWRNLRRIGAAEIFSSRRLDESLSIRRDEVRRLVQKLLRRGEEAAGSFARVELKSALTELTFNVMMRITAGKRYYGEDVSDAEEAKAFQEMIEEVFKYAGTAYPGDFLPVLRWVGYQGYEKRASELGKTMDRLLQGLVDEHRKEKKEKKVEESEEKKEKSMIEHLLSLQASDPEYYTDDIIKGFEQSILFAGIDTSTSTMEWAIANLLNHPTILNKAKAEIDSQIGHNRLTDESDLSRLPYLQNIISETLRLYPPAPLLLPHCSSDDCIIGGFNVPGGTVVLVNAWAIHRDAEQWSDPTSFKPERFESGDEKVNRLAIPFGLGRRACPGASLAHKMMGLTLGSLIQCFEWKRIGEQEVDMVEVEGLTMHREKPLEALCRPREFMDKVLYESSSNV